MTEFAARVDAFFDEYFAREPTRRDGRRAYHAYDGRWPDVSAKPPRPTGSPSSTAGGASSRAFADGDLDVDEQVDRDLLLGVARRVSVQRGRAARGRLEPDGLGLPDR